jgi:hypothetical protein
LDDTQRHEEEEGEVVEEEEQGDDVSEENGAHTRRRVMEEKVCCGIRSYQLIIESPFTCGLSRVLIIPELKKYKINTEHRTKTQHRERGIE